MRFPVLMPLAPPSIESDGPARLGDWRIREPRFNEAPQRLIGRARGEALPLHVAWLCVHYLLFRGKLAGFVSALRVLEMAGEWGNFCIVCALYWGSFYPM